MKEYQRKTVNRIISRMQESVEDNVEKSIIILQAPTGSGKTFMMTNFIKEVTETSNDDYCFLWVSIGKGDLHKQSYYSVKREFEEYPIARLLEDDFFGGRNYIEKNEVVFVNWEKLRNKDNDGNWKNSLMKDSEGTNFIELIQNTKTNKIKIILIIDESHYSANTDRANELRLEIVDPFLTIEMSATPTINDPMAKKVVVNPNDVIQAGMIKKQIIINDSISEIADDELTSQELVLQAAIEKREEIKNEYLKIDKDINPLVLIQIPNSDEGDEKKSFVENFLYLKGVTESNGKLAIWLSGEKTEDALSTITLNSSKVEYLIFKQAIDTGWDCPRATILVRFRETKSIVFEIQTVGRIMRMPETLHYDSEVLNTAYVYTNLKSLEIKKEDYNPNIIKSLISRKKSCNKNVTIESYYRSRTDFNDITKDFYEVLLGVISEEIEVEKGKKDYENNKNKMRNNGFNFDIKDSTDEIIEQTTLNFNSIDDLSSVENPSLYVSKLSDNDVFYLLEALIRRNLNGFAAKRSISTVRMAFYNAFRTLFNVNFMLDENSVKIQKILLANVDKTEMFVHKAISLYIPVAKKNISQKEKEIVNPDWYIEEVRSFNQHTHTLYSTNKNFYDVFYIENHNNKVNSLEKDFIDYIDSNETVDWWWKNGANHMATNFGIKNGDETFQPDFIIMFKNGTIGIFDTKPIGDRVLDTTHKSNSLSKYLNDKTRENFIGGIIVKDGNQFLFNPNYEMSYKDYREDKSQWLYLSSFLDEFK